MGMVIIFAHHSKVQNQRAISPRTMRFLQIHFLQGIYNELVTRSTDFIHVKYIYY